MSGVKVRPFCPTATSWTVVFALVFGEDAGEEVVLLVVVVVVEELPLSPYPYWAWMVGERERRERRKKVDFRMGMVVSGMMAIEFGCLCPVLSSIVEYI